jgi:hypothetical protein
VFLIKAGYDAKMATRDAILFQTSNNKLRKRVLAEDCDLAAVIKLGLAMEHSESKAGRLGPKMRQTVRCGGCRNWRGRLRD